MGIDKARMLWDFETVMEMAHSMGLEDDEVTLIDVSGELHVRHIPDSWYHVRLGEIDQKCVTAVFITTIGKELGEYLVCLSDCWCVAGGNMLFPCPNEYVARALLTQFQVGDCRG